MASLFDDESPNDSPALLERRRNVEELREFKKRHRSGASQDDDRPTPFQSQTCGGGRRVIRKKIGGD